MTPDSLANLTVIVTRPEHQAEPFCARVEALGGTAICFPTLEIKPPLSPETAQRLLNDIGLFDIVIYTSPNAVLKAHPSHPLALTATVLAVGKTTADTLKSVGYQNVILPALATSEALLEMPELQDVAGQMILIVAGEGGRKQLLESLKKRKAKVDKAEVYRRTMPRNDAQLLNPVWNAPEQAVVTLTSGDAARNLVEMIDKIRLKTLFRLPIIVGSGRIAAIARELGFVQPAIVAENPGDAPMLDALIEFASEPETSL